MDAASRTITCIDLDLDVIRIGERLVLDDEEEFALHRREMQYPDDIARQAERDAQAVLALARSSGSPIDGRAADWLARFAASRGL